MLLTNKSLLDDWSYDRVMLQLLRPAGTVNNITLHVYYMNHLLIRYHGVKDKCLLLTAGQIATTHLGFSVEFSFSQILLLLNTSRVNLESPTSPSTKESPVIW